jgi:hypothetical protein
VRAAVKGEFYGVTVLFVALLALRTLEVRFSEGVWRVDRFWLIPTAVMLALFVILRFIRKHMRLFEEPAPRDPTVS